VDLFSDASGIARERHLDGVKYALPMGAAFAILPAAFVMLVVCIGGTLGLLLPAAKRDPRSD